MNGTTSGTSGMLLFRNIRGAYTRENIQKKDGIFFFITYFTILILGGSKITVFFAPIDLRISFYTNIESEIKK